MNRIPQFLLLLLVAIRAANPLQVDSSLLPMKVAYEDGANYRWLSKPVLDSRSLDDMENLAAWTFRGKGEMVLSDVRSKQGHSLRMHADLQAPLTPDVRGSRIVGVTRRFEKEDWSGLNRISLWVYPDVTGVPSITLALFLRNDGEHKLPDGQNDGKNESIILNNRAWNHVVWEIAPLVRDAVTSLQIQYTYPKMLPEAGDNADLYLDKLDLERVAADQYQGWNVSPGKIAFSHSGYSVGSPKSAIASDLTEPQFDLVSQSTGEAILTKPVKQVKTSLGTFQELDFTEVRKPGMYVIRSGERTTRPFRIGDDVWRNSILKAVNFFYNERCGVEVPGVHGICHRDAYGVHGSQRIVINGGWHDAGDLSPTRRTPDVVYAMLSLADRLQTQGEDPELARRLIEESKWGLDWVLKTRFGDGYRIAGVLISYWSNGVMGDADDRVKEAEIDPELNFLDSAVEALAARMLRRTDSELAARCLRFAKEDWAFAAKELAEMPPPPPVYGQKDELERVSVGVLASVEMFRSTGDVEYANKAFDMAHILLASQERKLQPWSFPLAGFFYTSPTKENLFQRFHVGNEQAAIVALARLCDTFPENPEWMKWYSAVLLHSEYYQKAAARVNEPYGMLAAAVYRESDARLIPEKSESRQLETANRATFVEEVKQGIPLGGEYYLRRFPVWFSFRGHFSVLLSQTKALATAAHLRGDLDAADLAEKQTEWVTGRNPFSASGMYGEGYDWHPLYSERSGHIVGALPVGFETLGTSDEPYWPHQIGWTYKEVWSHSTSRWLWVMEDIGGPAVVVGTVDAPSSGPVEFREQMTGEITTVDPDFRHGTFRTVMPEGHYVVSHGAVHTSLTILPAAIYRVDLGASRALDFNVAAKTDHGREISIQISAEGAGRHSFGIRAQNLIIETPEQIVDLVANQPKVVIFRAKIVSSDTPWAGVVVPDRAMDRKREITGAEIQFKRGSK